MAGPVLPKKKKTSLTYLCKSPFYCFMNSHSWIHLISEQRSKRLPRLCGTHEKKVYVLIRFKKLTTLDVDRICMIEFEGDDLKSD